MFSHTLLLCTLGPLSTVRHRFSKRVEKESIVHSDCGLFSSADIVMHADARSTTFSAAMSCNKPCHAPAMPHASLLCVFAYASCKPICELTVLTQRPGTVRYTTIRSPCEPNDRTEPKRRRRREGGRGRHTHTHTHNSHTSSTLYTTQPVHPDPRNPLTFQWGEGGSPGGARLGKWPSSSLLSPNGVAHNEMGTPAHQDHPIPCKGKIPRKREVTRPLLLACKLIQ